MKINFFFTFSLLFLITKGQQIDNSSFESLNINNLLQEDKIFTTPEVMAFQKINFLPADLYTGKVNINIPLYEIKSGNITLPISLSYNAEGIKIDDEAADVGMNWVLNTGGNILRIVKDLEDHTMKYNIDYIYDYNSVSDLNLRPIGHYLTQKGFLKNYEDIKQITNFISYHDNHNNIANEDALPDLFLVNSPSLSSKFHFEKGNSYTKYKPKVIDGSGVKIEDVDYNEFSYENIKNIIGFNGKQVFGFESHQRNDEMTHFMKTNSWKYNPPKDYSHFKITNNNGLIYNFKDYDLIETIPLWNAIEEIPDPNITFYNTGSDFARFNHSLKKSVWHLNSIYDPTTNKEINLTYKTNISSKVYVKNMFIFKKMLHENSLNSINMELGNTENFIIQTENSPVEYEAIYRTQENEVIFNKLIQQKKISEIVWDKGKVEFLYNFNRMDKDNQKALTDIIVSDQYGNPIRHLSFQYSYFISKEKCDNPKCKRLKLININILNVNTSKIDQKYSFEYDESEPLPMIESLEQDYLGFYNKNGAKLVNGLDKHSMYFCPGMNKYSILPFKLNNTSCLHIPENHSLEANSYSLLGMLKKITYPTGGQIEFEYENHKFNLLGNEITAGGARIKKQKIRDDNSKYRIYSYEYNNNNTTSGYVNNIPKYGDLRSYLNKEKGCDDCYYYDPLDGCIEKCFPAEKKLFFYFYNRSKSEIELTNGSFVGYSKVTEREEGNGYKEYYYSSPIDYPNEQEKLLTDHGKLLARNSQYPGIAFVNNDVRTGKLLKELTYNEKNKIIHKNDFIYTYKLFDEYILDFRKTFIYPINPIIYTSVGFIDDKFRTYLRTERNLLTKKVTEEYLNNGSIKNITEYHYDSQYPLVKKEIKNINKRELVTKYQYPPDIKGNPLMQALTNQNRISTPITTEVLRKEDGNEKQISFTETKYAQDASTSNLILPKYIYAKKGETVLEKKITYDKYDEKGNLLQYTPEDGLTVSLIWGYNQQYPIAKIEGATYTEVKTYTENLQNLSNAGQEAKLLSAFISLRNGLPQAMITTYTYQPLVGVTSITAPNGLTEYYTYDSAGRLKEIKNQEGQLLKSFEYHYKSQN